MTACNCIFHDKRLKKYNKTFFANMLFSLTCAKTALNAVLSQLSIFHCCMFLSEELNLYTVYKTQSLSVCLSVCLSAIEIKLETFRYKQTYESYITFSREAKYSILISIRIVYGGLRAYIYSTYIKIWLFNVKI